MRISDWSSDVCSSDLELDAAIPEYQKAEAYYEGTVKEKFLNKAVQALLTGSDTDFRVNLAGLVVDAVQDRLEIAAVTAEPLEDPDAEEEIEEEPEPDHKTDSAPGLEGGEEPEEEERSEVQKAMEEALYQKWREKKI